MKLYGSIENRVEEQITSAAPIVGMGVTEYRWSDKYPYEVVYVFSPRKILVRAMTAYRIDGGGITEHQKYRYEHQEPECHMTVFPDGTMIKGYNNEKFLRLNKDGLWKEIGKPNGNTFRVGHAEAYIDPSF